MRIWTVAAGAFISWAAVWAATVEPKPTALTETVEKRLVQLDVSVEGDPDAIRGISAKDVVLRVGEREIQGVIVDHVCGELPASGSGAQDDRPGENQPPAAPPKVTGSRATFIFFFDQPHLTMAGRALALETASGLIARLVVEGRRASIVSSARRTETIVPMTGDREKLQAGLLKLRADLRQWDSYSETEERRAWEVANALSPTMGCLVAKGYAREEWQAAKRSTERIGATLGALAEVPAPKALVYFGDSLRQEAGLHYLEIPGTCSEAAAAAMVPSAAAEFDAVIDEALARGAHVFTVQAEGLLAYRPGWDANRHRDARDALVGLAAETGGEAFLGGASLEFIAGRIAARVSCPLLLSFPPGDLPRDEPLAVTLELRVPKVKIQTQGRIVVPSEASIERARLLAAFVDPASADEGALRILLVPHGGDGTNWHASVQLRLRPSGIPDTSAELGASIVRRDTVQDQFSASIAAKSGSRPIVLEKNVNIAPGSFSVVAVARDANRGDIASSRLEGDWPDPAGSEAAIAPIAALQSGKAAISKAGQVDSLAFLARDVDETLDPSASVTLETVVCRGAKTKAPIVVERWLEDGLAKEFAPMTIEDTDDPCVQTVDVVPPGRLRTSVVDYRVVARIGGEIVAQERRTLRVRTKP